MERHALKRLFSAQSGHPSFNARGARSRGVATLTISTIDRAVDQIVAAERTLTANMLATGQSGLQAAGNWFAAHPEGTRIRRSVEEISASGLTLAKLMVAANLLGDLVKG